MEILIIPILLAFGLFLLMILAAARHAQREQRTKEE